MPENPNPRFCHLPSRRPLTAAVSLGRGSESLPAIDAQRGFAVYSRGLQRSSAPLPALTHLPSTAKSPLPCVRSLCESGTMQRCGGTALGNWGNPEHHFLSVCCKSWAVVGDPRWSRAPHLLLLPCKHTPETPQTPLPLPSHRRQSSCHPTPPVSAEEGVKCLFIY